MAIDSMAPESPSQVGSGRTGTGDKEGVRFHGTQESQDWES